MTRFNAPQIMCDSMSGCTATETDYYEGYAHSVNGVRITQTHRAPGWFSTAHEDYCPKHAEEGRKR